MKPSSPPFSRIIITKMPHRKFIFIPLLRQEHAFVS